MAKGAGKARKKIPKALAVVRADNCTGCEACIEVCPVDCIYKVPGEDQPSLQSFVDIDLERCIGCALCDEFFYGLIEGLGVHLQALTEDVRHLIVAGEEGRNAGEFGDGKRGNRHFPGDGALQAARERAGTGE